MAININLKIEKKHLYLLSAIMVFLVGVGYVIAVNPASKPNPGHDSTELMINIGGADKTLQSAIDAGDFAGGGGGIGVLECVNVVDDDCSLGSTTCNAADYVTQLRYKTGQEVCDEINPSYKCIESDDVDDGAGSISCIRAFTANENGDDYVRCCRVGTATNGAVSFAAAMNTHTYNWILSGQTWFMMHGSSNAFKEVDIVEKRTPSQPTSEAQYLAQTWTAWAHRMLVCDIDNGWEPISCMNGWTGGDSGGNIIRVRDASGKEYRTYEGRAYVITTTCAKA